MAEPEESAAPEQPRERELVPTPAGEYPVVKDQTLEMPSGGVVVVREPSAFDMIEHGEIPKSIRAIAARAHGKGERPITDAEAVKLLNFFLAAAYVTPKVSLTHKTDDEWVNLHDISDDDREAVISALNLRDLCI